MRWNIYTLYAIHTIYANVQRRIQNRLEAKKQVFAIRSFLLTKLSLFVIWSSRNGSFNSHPLNNIFTNWPNLPYSWHVSLLYPCVARFGAIYSANKFKINVIKKLRFIQCPSVKWKTDASWSLHIPKTKNEMIMSKCVIEIPVLELNQLGSFVLFIHFISYRKIIKF